MAERDQIRRPLRRHDPGQPRGLKRIAFLHVARAYLAHRIPRHRDPSARHRFTRRGRLVADIDHADVPGLVHMGEAGRRGSRFAIRGSIGTMADARTTSRV
jgi:hypothetical protein